MAEALQTATNAAGGIARVRYTHDAMIDLILAQPNISQNLLAAAFGFTVGWVSRVINSDAFQARLAARKTELIDPSILATFDEKLKALADRSLGVLMEKLDVQNPSADLALEALKISQQAFGYGARDRGHGGNTNVQFVVTLPAKAESQEKWLEEHKGRPPATLDVTAKEVRNG